MYVMLQLFCGYSLCYMYYYFRCRMFYQFAYYCYYSSVVCYWVCFCICPCCLELVLGLLCQHIEKK
jgi:hypothetical protein